MKNKNAVKKKIAVILKLVILLIFLYSLIFVARSGKQEITIRTVSSFSSGSNLNALVDVKSKKTKENLESKLTIELLDNNEKKVKKVKEKYKTNNMLTDISVALPQELESGKYYLKVSAKAGVFKDVLKVPINITKEKKSETIISLDKGIYKPGDEINYRALIISKNDNTPIASNETVINIFDGNDNKVYSETTTTSNFGIVSGKFKLSDTVNSGTYKLVVSTINQSVTKEFIVNPYVTPKFEVSVTTDKEIYMVGEKANITVSAKYFFGEPVAAANIKGTIDGEEFEGITNESGSFTKEIDVEKSGTHTINLSVEDSSNYYIEANKSFAGATDIFEIEVLPEYNNLVRGVNNDIYFITKTADNNPVKTYMTVKIGNISREIITDENGIGKITLSSADIEEFSSYEYMFVVAKNMADEKVEEKIKLDIENASGTIVKTDKIKYEENDDIKVSLTTMTDSQAYKNLYIFKGKELIKTITFEDNEVEFNLEGVSGLIDICTDSNLRYHYNYYYKNDRKDLNYNHKTIFIKPSGALNISLKTDKDTYAPKENLNIKFDVTNEENKAVDSALLVSILDDAVLSLADNDLAVDNLKIALGDITLTDGITAADLYAMVLDDENPMQFASVLLKQNLDNKNSIIVDSLHYNSELYIYRVIMIVTGVLSLVIVFNTFMKKFEKFRKFVTSLNIALVDIIAIFMIIVIYCGELIFYELDLSAWITFSVCAVASIVLYNLILYKQKAYIFNLIVELIIAPEIIMAIICIPSKIFLADGIQVMILLGLLILLTILSVISRTKKLNKFWNVVKDIITILGKAIFFWIAVLLVSLICDSPIGFLIVLAVYVLYEKFVLKKTNIKIKDGKIIFNITGNELIGVFTGIMLLLIIAGVLSTMNSFSGNIRDNDIMIGESPSGGLSFGGAEEGAISKGMFDDIHTTIDSATSSGSSYDWESDIVNTFVPQGSSKENETEKLENKNEVPKVEVENKVESNVRNVFLESLAFVPELVTNSGKADLNLPISDNITSWNIQTIGNSKDGKIGFANSKFKVFKEFFVDFSLPTNTVVTDKVSIPVTVYNYTEGVLEVTLKVVQNNWSKIGEYTSVVNIPAKSTQMVYIPIEILKAGNNTLRIESSANNVSDIVEKNLKVSVNGLKKEAVVSSGAAEEKIEQDILFKEEAIENTKKVKVKLYPSSISQVIENMDAILEMPTGCFEQTSSSLYPDVLALEYLKKNNLNNPEIEEKALRYITAGYQKLLTYEVKVKKGGYSLYGSSPAEPVITAFGLMEMKDISKVYPVDEKVIENMAEYLFDVQKTNGSFDYNSTYIGSASSTDDLAMNAYITWALSEACPNDKRLEKSLNYLEKRLSKIDDNYTLALIGNAFANVKNPKAKDIVKRLMNDVENSDNESAYIASEVKGYYGSYGLNQNIQATALTSLLLTKEKSNEKTNKALINYIIEKKDPNGTWYSTQSTILALKAINSYNDNADSSNQKITVTFNGESKEIDIKDNILDIYELEFTNVEVENKISLSLKKGRIYYEIVKDYYETYEKAKQEQDFKSSSKLLVEQSINNQVNVNDIVSQKITITNLTKDNISNAIVRINIPQGCTVLEDSLLQLEYERKIEKFEYNYNTVDLYIRNYNVNDVKTLIVNYRTGYPEQITGASVSAYDYYNPEVNGICMPVEINVNAK